jgi:hypothetical protein
MGLAYRISVGPETKRVSEPMLDLERLQSQDQMRLRVQFSGGLVYGQQIAEGLGWNRESFYGESCQEDSTTAGYELQQDHHLESGGG